MPKLKHCKTLTKKEVKKFRMPRTITDGLIIPQEQFIKGNIGVLADSYKLNIRLGQSKISII